LREDRAWEDVTGRLLIPPGVSAEAFLTARAEGVAAGVTAAALAFRLRDRRCRARVLVQDGQTVRRGQKVLRVRGPLRSLLSAERTALNFLTHLSGIATLTRRCVRAAGPRGPRILDTRKTLPGLRVLEKWAVKCGGGLNHRFNLAEAVLIKENHLCFFQGKKGAAFLSEKIRRVHKKKLLVEMECRDKNEIQRGLAARADILLLDNFPPSRLAETVRWIKKTCREKSLRRPLLEASGGVTLERIRRIAKSGVDRISVGRLTHSAPALDMNMDVAIHESGRTHD